ncbi:curli production assembly/transport component CsgF [Persicitalea jodogahamensis]|uniref:Curli production assembly/transport component CsgF n=1 Tax=Persicitalea jodogahamensis TaxID=402147 RepID=A0A8J3D2G4_9BACT|nr:curli production assembly/transport component CsgF [Persicitalea jodogahamensis]GHB58357.1 curli production assembly/transport component CsgF [Persicitalea jodogahamensis]
MKKIILLLLFILTGATATMAQQLTYRPQNPNFGGNTFNYQWLQSSALAQDKLKDPNAVDFNTRSTATTTRNSLDDFSQTLSRQILNRISSQLLANQFGEDALQEGTFQFGDLRVDVTNGSNGVNIRIVDGQGGETTVTVPYF